MSDLALLGVVPRNPAGESEYVAQPSLDPSREPRVSDGYPCAQLAANARALAANPRDTKARLCLGDFWRLNGFDRAGEYRAAPKADELGGFAVAFAEQPLARRRCARVPAAIGPARQQARHRNLLASATGTGKTVMAAVDYGRLRNSLKRSRLLFVAHREEILDQTRNTFRHALPDAAFGEK